MVQEPENQKDEINKNMTLPSHIDPAAFDEHYRLQPVLWQEAILETCARHGIPADRIRAFADGSNLIAAVDDQYVVKIFPPFHRHQWESEYRVLQVLNGRLTFPIPELIASGERTDGWFYVILSLVPGVSLEDVWANLTLSEKSVLLEQIGKMMAEVHAVPVPTQLESLEPHWTDFLARQITGCRERHRKLKLPAWFMAGLEEFVQQALPLLPFAPESVILTGEYTPFNLLVMNTSGLWHISGMIDFGDAMIGYREYDLLGPGLFLCEGNRELLQCLLRGYGYSDVQVDQDLRRRLMLLAVLHRYSNFPVQLRIPGWRERAKSIEELEELIWPL